MGDRRIRAAVDRTRAPVVAVFALSLALFVTGCTANTPKAQLPAIVVGYRDLGAAVPALLAAHSGLKGQPYRLVARRFPSEAKLQEAFASGDVTFAVLPIVVAADLFVSSKPVVIVGATSESYGRDGIVTTDKLNSLDEVPGRAVAANGSSAAFFVWDMLDSAGVDPNAAAIDQKPYSAVSRSLDDGTHDVAVLSGAALAAAARRPDRRVLVTTKDFPGVLVDVIVVRKDYAKAHPDVVEAVVQAIARGGDKTARSARAADAVAAGEASTTAARVAAAASGLRYLTRQQVMELVGVSGSPGPIADVAARAVAFVADETGAQTPPEPVGLVDPRYINPGGK